VAEGLSPVVVGVDGSDPSRVAMRWAADEAVRRDRPLRIVHAVGPWAYATPLYPAPVVMGSVHEIGRAILERSVEDVRRWHPRLRVTTALLPEPPAVALRRQADEAYEVVVGHRGVGGFTGLLLGSVGLHTAGYANGPVVVVRDGDRPEKGEIVVGIDLSKHANAALAYAFGAAVVRGAGIRVVHAWCPPEGRYAVLEVSELRRVATESVREVMAPWRDRYPQVAVTETIIKEHPVKALAEVSADADLIVVAARGHTGVRFGSVSHGLIHRAACPVVVVHPDDDSGVA
jgi:nucleotide-binding universal stress UspA family protein